MDMKQILIFGLLLVPVWTCKMNRCLHEHELSEAAEKQLSHYPQHPELLQAKESGSPYSCPVEMFPQQLPQHINARSLSPWRYVLETKEDHFPSTYAKAQCLCSGCVLIQNKRPPVESPDYNSIHIMQSRVFLKKEPCGDGKKYRLRPVNVNVAVGCTCATVNSSF
ncbi:interleukin-17C [Cottoperca gobio]|uniref:Interleukin-17C n=1 Tax=Cottoperca gobio TaxID=56716 RepID=A0A6J2PRF7_COTGO|nr:interleukin-17C [Cottoperca gobio]